MTLYGKCFYPANLIAFITTRSQINDNLNSPPLGSQFDKESFVPNVSQSSCGSVLELNENELPHA